MWNEFISCLIQLRGAFSRKRTFYWFATIVISFVLRSDNLGVTSFVRGTKILPRCYHSLLNNFHSTAIKHNALLRLWIQLLLEILDPIMVSGAYVIVADGLKVSKEGRKMPGVKSLHQESANNSKPEFIICPLSTLGSYTLIFTRWSAKTCHNQVHINALV